MMWSQKQIDPPPPQTICTLRRPFAVIHQNYNVRVLLHFTVCSRLEQSRIVVSLVVRVLCKVKVTDSFPLPLIS